MVNKLEIIKPNDYSKSEKQGLPSVQDTLRQATLRLGGPSGEVVEVKDIRYYLGARLLLHLESGDTTSEDYQLLQKAQDLSSPTGVHAAIEIFRAQSESLRKEFSTTPKDKRGRDLIREGVALGLSIVKLEKEMLPKSQKPTVEQEPIPEHGSVGHQTSSEKPDLTKEEIERAKATFGVWYQPVGHKITEKEVDILLDASLIIKPALVGDLFIDNLVLMTIPDLVKKARDFKNNKEGRGAVVELAKIQAETIISTISRLEAPDADERISRVRHVVTSVQELMGEFEKGSSRY